MIASSWSGGIPALVDSPARSTSIMISRPGRAWSRWRSSSRMADSDATEWITRTRGTIKRTRRLWSWPMKSHRNSSPCAWTLAWRSWARFSPTSRTPPRASRGMSSSETYLVAARISTGGSLASARSRGAACGRRGDLLFDPREVLPHPAGIDPGDQVNQAIPACLPARAPSRRWE